MYITIQYIHTSYVIHTHTHIHTYACAHTHIHTNTQTLTWHELVQLTKTQWSQFKQTCRYKIGRPLSTATSHEYSWQTSLNYNYLHKPDHLTSLQTTQSSYSLTGIYRMGRPWTLQPLMNAISDIPRTMHTNLIMITWQALDPTHGITQFIVYYFIATLCTQLITS